MLRESEAQKYRAAWEGDEYRRACHSLELWRSRQELFPQFSSALDIGCGTGRLLAAWLRLGIDAWGVDIADNCLDTTIAEQLGHRFVCVPLWDMHWGWRFDFGVCADVMEHIPPVMVPQVLEQIAAACKEVLFKIAHVPDVCGGGSYHLTVEPLDWWLSRMPGAQFLGTVRRSGFDDSLIRWRP